MVKLAYPTLPVINQEELVRQQFLQDLSRENQVEARRIGSKLQPLKHTTPAPAPVKQHPQLVFCDDGKERMLMLAYRLGFPQPDNEDTVTLEELEKFIDKELRGRLTPDDYYHQTYQVKKVFGMNTSIMLMLISLENLLANVLSMVNLG